MISQLESVAQALVAPGRGILAADESMGTIKKRFLTIDLESTEDSRRAYRELLFSTPGMERYISGVILFDETIRQTTREGRMFVRFLSDLGVIPGIKVDTGTIDMPLHSGEKVTEGLDGLRNRLGMYRDVGARFAKWRAVITIGPGLPSRACLNDNAQSLARYAALAQEAGLVPIVEPEVIMEGDHSIEQCQAVTLETLGIVYQHLRDYDVALEGTLLKPNMVVSGKGNARQAAPDEVAERTVRTLRRAVPTAVPGIVFLSGGQSAQEATVHLNAINALGPHPWQISFSYGRALQDPALRTWAGKDANAIEAQRQFYHRAKMNGAARDGVYKVDMELISD